MHICLDFIPELLNMPQLEKQVNITCESLSEVLNWKVQTSFETNRRLQKRGGMGYFPKSLPFISES